MNKKMYSDDSDVERQGRIGFKSYLENVRLAERAAEDDIGAVEVVENIAFSSLKLVEVEDHETGTSNDIRHITIGDSHLVMDMNTWDAVKDIKEGEEFIICLTDEDGNLVDYHVTRNEEDYVIFKEYESTGKSGKIDFTSLSNRFSQ